VTELVRFTQRIRSSILAGNFANEFAHWLRPADDLAAAARLDD
jgi:hypothetical protein